METVEAEGAPTQDVAAESLPDSVEEPTGAPEPVQEDDSTAAIFALDDVPEDQREYVERWIATTRPNVSRALNEAKQTRAEAEEALALAQALQEPDQAFETLQQILDHYGLDLSREAWEAAQGNEDYDGDDEQREMDPALKELLEDKRAREAREREEQQQAGVQQIRDASNNHFKALAEARGYGEAVEDVPQPVREAVAAFAAVMPELEDGLPDMQGAQEAYEAAMAHEVERYLRAKKDVPKPATDGSPGTRKIDIKSQKDRLALASEVAARHL